MKNDKLKMKKAKTEKIEIILYRKTYHLPLANARVLLLPERGDSPHTLFHSKCPLLPEGVMARSDGVVGLYRLSTRIFILH
jgi:hypothetical protein